MTEASPIYLFDWDHTSPEKFGVPNHHQPLVPKFTRHIDMTDSHSRNLTHNPVFERYSVIWWNLAELELLTPGNPDLLHGIRSERLRWSRSPYSRAVSPSRDLILSSALKQDGLVSADFCVLRKPQLLSFPPSEFISCNTPSY
jgi:hypothetical protein